MQLVAGCKRKELKFKATLKPAFGVHQVVHVELPATWEKDGSLIPKPQAVLDRRVPKRKWEILVHWQRLAIAEAYWETEDEFKLRFSDFVLEDKDTTQGEAIIMCRAPVSCMQATVRRMKQRARWTRLYAQWTMGKDCL
uniref:Chromo domain-containing protein n=1 Tax=Nelumbo nucifera TaxID=4432 RepID=A0A822Z307_NELNU|nr:TPA_asm: hypothetical protein HUJ06_013215 [Nelumbo nucifera]